jgi:hypothetical protein
MRSKNVSYIAQTQIFFIFINSLLFLFWAICQFYFRFYFCCGLICVSVLYFDWILGIRFWFLVWFMCTKCFSLFHRKPLLLSSTFQTCSQISHLKVFMKLKQPWRVLYQYLFLSSRTILFGLKQIVIVDEKLESKVVVLVDEKINEVNSK